MSELTLKSNPHLPQAASIGPDVHTTADAKARQAEVVRAMNIVELRERLHAVTSEARRRPVTLELCCGHGHYLANLAPVRPESFFLGVDYCRDRIERAERKQQRLDCDNLRFLRAEVFELLQAWPAGTPIAEVILLFPDPWPKRRHHKNRVFSSRLLDGLVPLCTKHAQVFFRTDSEDYFDHARRTVAANAGWREDHDARWPVEHATIFEQKAERYFSLALARGSPMGSPTR